MTAPPARTGRGIDPRVQRSRQVVLAAALELMVERGMFATTIDAVAERSKVAKTTIYRQWPNRDALVADVWAAIPPPSVPPLTGELDADVLAAAAAIHDRLRTPPMSVLFPDLLTAAARDPALAALQDRVLQARRRPLSEIVSRAALDGRLPPGTDAGLVAALIVGAIVYRRLVRPGPPEAGAGVGDGADAGPDDRAVVRRLVLAVLASARAGLLTTSDVFPEPSG